LGKKSYENRGEEWGVSSPDICNNLPREGGFGKKSKREEGRSGCDPIPSAGLLRTGGLGNRAYLIKVGLGGKDKLRKREGGGILNLNDSYIYPLLWLPDLLKLLDNLRQYRQQVTGDHTGISHLFPDCLTGSGVQPDA